MNDHPTAKLEAFVADGLPAIEMDAILDHLGHCDTCLARVDALMALPDEALAGLADALPAAQARSTRMERQIARRIQRSEFGGRLVRFSTVGLADVFVALLKPLLSPAKRGTAPAKRERPSSSEGASP